MKKLVWIILLAFTVNLGYTAVKAYQHFSLKKVKTTLKSHICCQEDEDPWGGED